MSKPVTAPDIRTHKVKDGHDPLVMVTAYDAPGRASPMRRAST